MILLQAVDINKSFGATPILSNINMTLQSGERVGMVGINGAGKSTLLKIITGSLLADSGEIRTAKELTVGYLAQDSGLNTDKNIFAEMLTVFEDLIQQEKQLRKLEEQMGDPKVHDNEGQYERLMQTYSTLSDSFKIQGGYQYEATIRSVLHGMRFYPKDYDTPIASLSGGQKTRLALARLLLLQPDILVLDEPTNYLDIDTLSWLEKYLTNYPGALLVVSHDRFFLDALVNVVYEIERHQITRYTGNYSDYLDEKAEQVARKAKQYEKQQAEVSKIEDFIRRNIARASTTRRAQSRKKQLDRMDLMERPLHELKKATFQFQVNKTSGNQVALIHELMIGYGPDKLIAGPLTLNLTRGERVALIGPNGQGKTTLLKTLTGRIPNLGGQLRFGSNVETGFYNQEQEDLHLGKTVLEEVWDAFPTLQEKDIRTVLGNFLFSGEDVLKKVGDLSGGERARVALARLIFGKANFLILDEPTNHLDLFSKEVLEEALLEYPGTVLFVSHDRYFMNKIATRILELTPEGLASYPGNYDYYLAKKEELEELEEIKRQQATTKEIPVDKSENNQGKERFLQDKETKKKERQKQRKIEEIETRIEQLETDISTLEEDLCSPDVFADVEKARHIHETMEERKKELEGCLEEWTALQED